MKFTTPVIVTPPERPFRLSDRIVLLGSCFADNLAVKLAAAGFDVCANPFGTLYNPASIVEAAALLDSGKPFGKEDCVPMGAGADRICSFRHHTSFSRPTEEEFLEHSNEELRKASESWLKADRVVITLGTALVWYHGGKAVANCLKRPASEFTRRMLEVNEIGAMLQGLVDSHPGKRFLFTVSPIRHLSDGAHVNSLSKASLLLGADACTGAEYFPAFEIVNDELRDYRFYADDLVHPSAQAVGYVWERFLETWVDPADLPAIAENEKAARIASHRRILK